MAGKKFAGNDPNPPWEIPVKTGRPKGSRRKLFALFPNSGKLIAPLPENNPPQMRSSFSDHDQP
jgi:hypothetical protein